MKRTILILMILISALTLNALDKTSQTFTVRGISDGPVMIDGKATAIGKKFNSNSSIKWTSIDQSLTVWNGKRLIYFYPTKKQIGRTIKTSQAFTSTNNLAIRRDMPNTIDYHNNAFQQIDTLKHNTIIPTGWDADGFTISFVNPTDNKTIERAIESDNDNLLISTGLFERVNVTAPTTIIVNITYTNSKGNTTELQPWIVTLLPDTDQHETTHAIKI